MKISSPPSSVAGFKAVTKSFSYILKRLSLAKSVGLMTKLNQKEGIDCPGCAWPDPAKRSKLGEFCENGIKAIAEEAMERKVDLAFFAKHSVKQMLQESDYWLGQQGRLTHPMVIRDGELHYTPISWDKAFRLIAENLNTLNSPDEAVFYTSGRTSNEAAFLYQLFVRMYGTNNLPDCSNMCHESSGAALTETLGIGKGSVTLEDFDKAEVILIFGQNPATNHPRMLSALEKAKKNGATIVSINPLKEAGLVRFKNPQTANGILGNGTKISDLYLQLRINEDVALLKAVMKILIERSKNDSTILDNEFITDKTSGFDQLLSDLEQYSTDDLIARTGLHEEQVLSLVDLLSQKNKIIACWAMGLTQHKNGVDNIREVVNLLLLKGSIGKEGAGTCPVRGHSNVQGDRTMGIHERPSKKLLDKITENFGFNPPTSHGYSVIEAIEAMYKGDAKVFFALGGNFLPASPDTNFTSEALRNCELTVHVSTKLNRSHLVHGKTALILPCLGRTDRQQAQTVENSMGVVHTSKGFLNPPSKELLSEVEIICRLAETCLPESKVQWSELSKDYSLIRDLIEKTIVGFDDYNQKVKTGFDLYNGARIGEFHTSDNKAQFSINALPNYPLKDGEFVMMTIRSHDQFNTTVYGLDDRYRGISNGRMVVFMNPQDIADLGKSPGDIVSLYNNYEGKTREVNGFEIVSYDIPPKCLATYFPEANPLIPITEYAHTSLTPASKSVKVRMK